MNHPRMTESGRRWAFVIGIIVAFALPKHVECGYPDAECRHYVEAERAECVSYEVEPWGFSLIEKLVGHDVGFAYSSGEECN